MKTMLTIAGILSISLTALVGNAQTQSVPRINDSDIQQVDYNKVKYPDVTPQEFLSCQRRAIVLLSANRELTATQKKLVTQALVAKGHKVMLDDRDASFPLETVYLAPDRTETIDTATHKPALLVDQAKVDALVKKYEQTKILKYDDILATFLSDRKIRTMKLEANVEFDVMFKNFAVTNSQALKEFDKQWKVITDANPESGFDNGLPGNDRLAASLRVKVPVTGMEVKKAQLEAVQQMLKLTGGKESESHIGDLNIISVLMALGESPDLRVSGLLKIADTLPDCSNVK